MLRLTCLMTPIIHGSRWPSGPLGDDASSVEHLFYLLFQLGLLERTTLNLVEANGVHKILGAQDPQKLTHVELWHQNLFIALDYIAQVRWQRVQMAQMHVADLATLSPLSL